MKILNLDYNIYLFLGKGLRCPSIPIDKPTRYTLYTYLVLSKESLNLSN